MRFFLARREKIEKFGIFRGNFPNPNPNQTFWPDLTHFKKNLTQTYHLDTLSHGNGSLQWLWLWVTYPKESSLESILHKIINYFYYYRWTKRNSFNYFLEPLQHTQGVDYFSLGCHNISEVPQVSHYNLIFLKIK